MPRGIRFTDRTEAGRLLADRLAVLGAPDPIVLALPRGGVPVAAEIARRLQAPLDVVLVRKIGAPFQPELAIGAVADGDEPEIVVNWDLVRELGIGRDHIAAEAAREFATLQQRGRKYAPLRPALDLAGRTVIVVDDGVATGMTMQAALRYARRRLPQLCIAAVPVASREAAAMLAGDADQVICLHMPRHFGSVGAFYRSFGQTTDAEVEALLRAAQLARP